MSEPGFPQGHPGQQPGVEARSIAAFHCALQAALHAGVALDLGRAATPRQERRSPANVASNHSRSVPEIPSGRLTLRKLHALQALAQAASAGQREEEADPHAVLAAMFGDRAAELPQKYINGLSLYWVTGRTDLVLEALSVDRRAERELARVARPSLAYLAILVVTAIIGSGVLAVMLLSVDELRSDLLRAPHSLGVSSAVTPWLPDSTFTLLPWIALLVVLLALASLLTPVAAAIAKGLGGLGYLISQRRATAARIEHALMLVDIDGAEAEQTANDLVGSRPRWERTGRTGTGNQRLSSDLPRSRLEAKHYLVRANMRLRQLRLGLPLLLVITLGSVGVLLYSLALFLPLTQLLHEMAAPLVDPVMGGVKR